MAAHIAFQLVLIALLAFGCQWAAWRIKLPAILPLLLVGLALGPVGANLIQPQSLFGPLLLPGVALAVAIILFEGAMTLRLEEIRGLEGTVRRLLTWGVLITWAVMSSACYWLTDLGVELSLLFGALVVVTGPTVIVPLLRSVRPVSTVARLLRWEGIVIDPLGAMLAVIAYELVVTAGQEQALWHGFTLFLATVGVGIAIGVVTAIALAELLKRHLVPEYLRSFLVLSVVLFTYVLANSLKEESGLVTVTVTGLVLANRGVRTEDILHFKENLSLMLISGLFIVLAARIEPAQLTQLGLPTLLLLAVVQLVARPLSVYFSTLGSNLGWREKALLSWIAPRGIVAAAVSALFAERLSSQGVAHADMLVPLTFMIIIGTVALQSITARPLAQLLKLAEPAPRGFLIVGANNVARAIGEALSKNDIPVMLTDSNWENIRAARMAGLGTFFGNPVSQHADQTLDLVGIGHLLGLSQRRELNTLASMRYRLEFGEPNVFSLPEPAAQDEKHAPAPEHRGGTLFGTDMTYARLASLMAKGAEMRKTRLTDEYDFQAYLNTPQRQVWPLFALDTRDMLHVFTAESKPAPQSGWHIIGLVMDEKPKDDGSPEKPSSQHQEANAK